MDDEFSIAWKNPRFTPAVLPAELYKRDPFRIYNDTVSTGALCPNHDRARVDYGCLRTSLPGLQRVCNMIKFRHSLAIITVLQFS